MKLLVASINDVKEVTDLAASGVTSFALKKSVIEQLLDDPHTKQVAREFEEAAAENAGIKVYRRSNTI